MIAMAAPPRRSLTAPAVALVVAIAAGAGLVGGALAARGEVEAAGDDAERVNHVAAIARGDVGTADVVLALQDERSFAGAVMVGMDDLIDLPYSSMDEAARTTDAAIADARARQAAPGEPGSAPLERAMSELVDDLPDLRARVAGPGSLDRLDEAASVAAAYDDVVDTLV